jgi:hypothetical protein
LALAVSAASLWFTARSFYVTQRPYIGIVEQRYNLLGNPPSGMAWAFVLSNVGSRPAWVRVEEHRTSVTRGGKTVDLPLLGPPGGGIYLMPGQKAPLNGQFSDANGAVTVQEVLLGTAKLRSTIRISYAGESPFIGERKFTYFAVSEFRHYVMPQGFYMVEGRGN